MNPQAEKHGYAGLPSDPPVVKALFHGGEVYPNLTAADFREMGKFTEETNVLGLPAHPISRPIGGAGARELSGTLEDEGPKLSRRFLPRLRDLLASEPCVRVEGLIAGSCRRPYRVAAFVQQSAAHLAHALTELLWEISEPGDSISPCDLILVFWPECEDQAILHVPASRLGLVLGTDDPRAGMLLAIESANRLWNSNEKEKDGGGLIQLLPGGSFVLGREAGGENEEFRREGTLIFSGESIPDEWEKWLIGHVDSLAGREGIECLLAGAEPWVAESVRGVDGGKSEGRVSPFFRNPPLPAALLGGCKAWQACTFDPDALPFGVRVDSRGKLHLAPKLPGEEENSFVIVPRRAIPPPFANAAIAQKVVRLLTHKHVKNDAMKLWAAGFPTPEII